VILERRSVPGEAVPITHPADVEEAAMGEPVGKRVLLVEDEPVLQRLIARYLVAGGYAVQTAVDGLDAIKKLRAGLPDLIISDLNMPRMDGVVFLHVVRRRFPQIPVMLIGDKTPDALPGGVTADAYFQKNRFGFHQLPEAIEELTKRLDPRPALPPIENVPAKARPDESDNFIIDCPDCLREFSIPRIIGIGWAEKWTICVHCGRMVQFIVDEQFEDT
jgi:CheY-like chemotaxis protein